MRPFICKLIQSILYSNIFIQRKSNIRIMIKFWRFIIYFLNNSLDLLQKSCFTLILRLGKGLKIFIYSFDFLLI